MQSGFEGHSTIEAVMLALTAITGMLGGCAVASYHALHGKRRFEVYAIAYATLGMVFGVATYLVMAVVSPDHLTDERVLLLAMISGVLGPVVLAGTNLTMRVVLRRFGWEAELVVRRSTPKNTAGEP